MSDDLPAPKLSLRSQPLELSHPAIAAEWHPQKNDRPTSAVTASSHYYAWWRCQNDETHEWRRSVVRRTAFDSRCPFCLLNKTSLASLFPELKNEWHQTLNGSGSFESSLPGSAESVWWQCPENATHVYKMRIQRRTKEKRGCPICARVKPERSLIFVSPLLSAEWHPVKNGALKPSQASSRSQAKVWWKCSRDPKHEWSAPINGRVRGVG